MKSFIFFIAILCCVFMAAAPAVAQNYQQMLQDILQKQDSTKSEIEQLDALINQYQQQLSRTEKEYDKIYAQYENLKRLLALQKQKIASLQKKRRQINAEAAVIEKKLSKQEKELKELIEEYKQTMRYVYKNGRTSQLALILSSGSVNQLMVRNYYLKKFESFRENQAEEIKETQKALRESRQQLDEAAERNKEILAEIQVEEEELQKKSTEQQANVKLLRQEKEKNERKVSQLSQQKKELNSTLAEQIALEEKAREAERERRLEEQRQQQLNITSNEDATVEEGNAPAERTLAENTGNNSSIGFINDEELAKIENAFTSQKGALAWPVESTTVSEHFGRKRHPVYGTITPNLGIEIVTEPSAPVKAVHEGYVFNLQPIAGYGDVVFVSHGKYKTAYGNLSKVLVRKNTILKKGDVVGYSGDQNSTRGESVFFMLRNGNQNVDPEKWLK